MEIQGKFKENIGDIWKIYCENTGEKSRIRETKNFLTDADRRTDTILERLRDLSKKLK